MDMCIKKTLLYRERNELLRVEYLKELKSIPVEDIVYIDESGVDHNMISEHCWTKKGTQVVGERNGKARGRTSVVAALNVDNLNAPMTYQGTMNTELFIHWIQCLLIPSLSKGQVVIMDNASIHKNKRIREMIENAGCKLLYLPTYSPDLNPIENYWAVMKKMIRKIRNQYENIGEAMDVVLQNNKRYFNS